MPTLLPAVPYPPAGDGYWGPVTATLDWCEENYYATTYCAEIINTITNLMFAYLGLKGVRVVLQNGHDSVYLIALVAYMIIGIGSFLFHSTLTLEMQLLDEISMIYTSCVMVYAAFSHDRSALQRFLIAFASTAAAIFITVYYFYLGDPVFHQVAFAALTLLVLFRNLYVMETTLRPSRRKLDAATLAKMSPAQKAERERCDARDAKILRQLYNMVGFSLFCAYGGFAIWNLDNIYCSKIRRWRYDLGMPWGFILEGHGWWHVMTGTAAYCNIQYNIWIRYCVRGQQDEVELYWPRLFFSVPVVQKKKNSQIAGHAKKTR